MKKLPAWIKLIIVCALCVGIVAVLVWIIDRL